ncbi:hybrid sensor histidine kinase/response regulator transcription factor [Flagellimonas sp. 2504JD4-2]
MSKLRKKRHLVVLCFFLFVGTCVAQSEKDRLVFENIESITTGDPISSIAQDESNLTWIGTFGSGLYSFDGINFKAYAHRIDGGSQIGSNLIHFTFLDREGRLWVGTDSGLHLYQKNTDRFKKIVFSSELDLQEHINFTCVIQEESGDFIFGTYEYGALRYTPGDNKLQKIQFAAQLSKEPIITSFGKVIEDEIFTGTDEGLYLLNGTNQLVRASSEFAELAETDDLNIASLMSDAGSHLWIGSADEGLFRLTRTERGYRMDKFSVTDKKIFSILNSKGTVLLGTENDGLIVMEEDGSSVEKYTYSDYDSKGISSNSIWSLYMDNEDRLWLGHYGAGMDVHDKHSTKFGSLEKIINDKNSLLSNSVTGLDKDKSGNLWISLDGGVDIYDPITREITHLTGAMDDIYPGLHPGIRAENIFADSRGNIWIGTWENGIYLLDKNRKRFLNYTSSNTKGVLKTNTIRGFAEDNQGKIWIASFLKGLFYFDPEERRIVHCDSKPFEDLGIMDHDIMTIMVDKTNAIWLGTSSGLFKVIQNEESGFQVKSLKNELTEVSADHPSLHRISSLYQAKNDVFIGTDGAGLFKYNFEDDVFSSCNARYKLKENTINSIIQGDDGTLWIGGKSGITKIDLELNTSANFGTKDGLTTNYFNKAAIEVCNEGKIYFGSYSGINFVDPQHLAFNTNKPHLYFTDFKLFNKSVSIDDEGSPLSRVISQTREVTLTHKQSVFTLEYVGAGHTRAEKNQYAYMLEGFDHQWSNVGGSRSVTYTNLEPGDYTFKVKVANHDGVWNEDPLTLKIEILPPWWKSRWAYTIYVLAISGLLTFLTFFFKEKLRRKQLNLLKREKIKQEKELHEAKFQFFTNISHEFRTPLTLIMNPIEDLLNHNKLGSFPRAKRKLLTIKRNSDRLSRLINELMDFRKLQSNNVFLSVNQVDIVEVVKNVLSHFLEEAEHRKINLDYDVEQEELLAWVDSSMMEKILFNIVSNAFKMTPEGGQIEVKVNLSRSCSTAQQEANSFAISVKDTGYGIAEGDHAQIFKRFYQVDSMNNTYYGSSGIGLEMVKSFVELHHGTIEVESELGKGSKFIVTLPLGKQHFKKEEIAQEIPKSNLGVVNSEFVPDPVTVESVKDSLPIDKKTKTILIVEDNIELQNYLRIELDELFNTLVAPNGRVGLELALEHQPDLIITDVIMPELNGLDLCKKIKADIKTSHIPLLMLTARAMVEDKIKGLDSGADAYLNKPFHIDVLRATIAQLLLSRKILFDKYHQNKTLEKPNATTAMDNRFIAKVLHFIHKNIEDPDLSVDQLASDLYLSRSQLYRKIKSLTGMTAIEFLRKIRLEEAKKLLSSENNYNVSEVAFKVGFTSPSYFTKCFKKEFGCLPKENW